MPNKKISTPGLDLPEEQAEMVYRALAARAGWTPQIRNNSGVLIDNPTTKEEASREYIIAFIKKEVRLHTVDQSQKALLEQINRIDIDIQ